VLVTALALRGMRNLAPLELAPGPRFNVFAGDNGQGKTNLLEAVYVLAALRSFRTNRLAEVIGHGAERAELRARITRHELERSYRVVIEPERKTALVDDKPVRPVARYFGAFNVVLFAPEDLAVVRGPPADRRRFLDRTVFGRKASFLATAQAFDKVLRSRNAVLRAISEGDRAGHGLLDVYDQQLAPLAVAMAAERAGLLDAMGPAAGGGLRRDHGRRAGGLVDLPAGAGAGLDRGDAGDLGGRARQGRRAALDLHRTPPRRSGLPTWPATTRRPSRPRARPGPWCWPGRSPSSSCSRTPHGDPPLLLLDDVSSELDDTRNEFLFAHLRKRLGQCLITTTDARHVRIPGDRVDYRVAEGRISPVISAG
jgi:DNA replication and repair protein RecF